MTKTQHQKLEVPFHRLTEEEIRQWYQDKLLTTAGYLLAIKRVTRPPGAEFVIPNVIKFCKEWGISKSAFYRAVDELKRKGYTNWEATHGIVLRESRKILSFPSEKKCPTRGTLSHERDGKSHERDSQSHKRDGQSHERDSQSHKRENRSRKHSQRKASSTPQTIQTYTDFIQTLSESEKESFLTFGLEKCKSLPKLPTLPMKWIEANWQELYAQFNSMAEAGAASIADTDWTQHSDWEDWLAQMREGVPRFVALGTCFDNKTRRAIADWAEERGLIWGAES